MLGRGLDGERVSSGMTQLSRFCFSAIIWVRESAPVSCLAVVRAVDWIRNSLILHIVACQFFAKPLLILRPRAMFTSMSSSLGLYFWKQSLSSS